MWMTSKRKSVSQLDALPARAPRYVMLAGRFPFKASTQRELYRRIVRGSFQALENVVRDARLRQDRVAVAVGELSHSCLAVKNAYSGLQGHIMGRLPCPKILKTPRKTWKQCVSAIQTREAELFCRRQRPGSSSTPCCRRTRTSGPRWSRCLPGPGWPWRPPRPRAPPWAGLCAASFSSREAVICSS